MTKQRHWWDKPFRLVHFVNPFVEEVRTLDVAETAARKAELGFDVEQQDFSNPWGGEQGEFYFKSDHGVTLVRDLLGEYLPEARKRGIKVLAYFNVHWLAGKLVEDHPDWLRRHPDGRPIVPGYGTGAYACVNTPFRDWCADVYRDLLAYGIAGIFLDGPVGGICYCETCKRLFREKHSLDIPEKEPARDAPERGIWRKYMLFRSQSMADFMRDGYAAVKAANPEAMFYMNASGAAPQAGNGDNRELIKHQDILASEGGFVFYGPPADTPLWKPGNAAKLLETQAGGKPVIGFIAGDWKPWDYYILGETEITLMFASIQANGANPYYSIFWVDAHKPQVDVAKKLNAFRKKNVEYLGNTTSLADVALLWSGASVTSYPATWAETDFTAHKKAEVRSRGDYAASYNGAYDILFRSHVPFDVIDEPALAEDRMSRYQSIVCPNCACLSDAAAESIRKFVADGGTLIATYETSLLDDEGCQREDFALADVFGASHAGPITTLSHYAAGIDYTQLAEDCRFGAEFSQPLFPAPLHRLAVNLTTGRALANFLDPMTGRYLALPPVSNSPAWIENEFGKGRCFYLPGAVCEQFWTYRVPENRLMLTSSIPPEAARRVRFENLPDSVEVVLREQSEQKRTILHLVNFTGEMSRPIEKVIPCRDIGIALDAEGGFSKVRALMLGEDLPARRENGILRFELPVLNEYEAIVCS